MSSGFLAVTSGEFSLSSLNITFSIVGVGGCGDGDVVDVVRGAVVVSVVGVVVDVVVTQYLFARILLPAIPH